MPRPLCLRAMPPVAGPNSTRVAYRGRAFSVRVDTLVEPGGGERRVRREVVVHPPSVVILAVTGTGAAARVLLVGQYRHAVGRRLWELPAGGVEPGESPAAAARRELREETGFTARRWQRLGCYFPSPGVLSEKMYVYLACGLTAGPAAPEPDEKLTLRSISVRRLAARIARGGVEDGKLLAAWACWVGNHPT